MTETRTDAVTGISGAHLYMYLAGLSVYITENMPSLDEEDDDERMGQFLRDVQREMQSLSDAIDSILPQEDEMTAWHESDNLPSAIDAFAGWIALFMPSFRQGKQFLAFLGVARSELRRLIGGIDAVGKTHVG